MGLKHGKIHFGLPFNLVSLRKMANFTYGMYQVYQLKTDKRTDVGVYLYGPANIINGSGQADTGYSSELSTLVATAMNPNLPPFFDFGSSQ